MTSVGDLLMSIKILVSTDQEWFFLSQDKTLINIKFRNNKFQEISTSNKNTVKIGKQTSYRRPLSHKIKLEQTFLDKTAQMSLKCW